MSYILEALKKAQAERQLGNAPTIHAPAPSYAAPSAAPAASRRYLAIGLGAGALVAAAAILWPRTPVQAPAPAPVQTAVAPAPAPVVVAPAPLPEVPKETPVKRRGEAPKPAPKPVPVRPEPEPVQVAAAPVPAPAPAPEEQVGTLQQLPEAVQREVPKVAFGGYIYSPNPSERLLLVDKMLRREGEEVAPGLVLERLGPKAAVMNYRGHRYRVGY
jgi:general secretion pathway protein B